MDTSWWTVSCNTREIGEQSENRITISLKGQRWSRDLHLLWVWCSLFCIRVNFWWHPHFFSLSPPLPPAMSHPERKNPCITKQLDQKPPVMQQGSVAPYLLPRWEMEGEGVSGWEGPRNGCRGGAGGLQEQEYESHINTATFTREGKGFYPCWKIALCVHLCVGSCRLRSDGVLNVWGEMKVSLRVGRLIFPVSSDASQLNVSKGIRYESVVANSCPLWISLESLLKSLSDNEAH